MQDQNKRNHHVLSLTLPTLCRLCKRWQNQVFCQVCLQDSSIFIPRCQRCAIALPHVSNNDHSLNLLCRLCQEHPPIFDHALAAFDYALPWNTLISQFKFHQDTALARPLVDLLVPKIWSQWQLPKQPNKPALLRLRAGAPSLILPVPLSSERLRERGYNQSTLLAKQLGKQLHLPVNSQLLIRRQNTQRLMLMSSQDRHRQIRGAFGLAAGANQWLRNRHVAVVDDVLTTGATLNEIARILWQAGTREVSVWVIARTPV